MRAAWDSSSTVDVAAAVNLVRSYHSDVFNPIDIDNAFDAASELFAGTDSITDLLSRAVSVNDILNASTSSDALNADTDLSGDPDSTSAWFNEIVSKNDFLNPAAGVDAISDTMSHAVDASDVFGDANSINRLFQNLRECYYRSCLNRTNSIDELLNVNNSNAPNTYTVGSSMFSDSIANSASLHRDNIDDISNQASVVSEYSNSIINNILNPSSNITHSIHPTLNSNNSFSSLTVNNSRVYQPINKGHTYNCNTDNHLSNSFLNKIPVNSNANTETLPVYTTSRPTSFENTSDSFQRATYTTSNLVSIPLINSLASLRVKTNVTSTAESSTLSSTYASDTRLSKSSYYSQNNRENLIGINSTVSDVTSRDSFSSLPTTSHGAKEDLNLNTSDSLNRTLESPPSGARNLNSCRSNVISSQGTGDSVLPSTNAALTPSEMFLNSLARAAVSPSGGADLLSTGIPTSTCSTSQPINVSASDSLVLRNARNSNVRRTTPEYTYNSSWTMPTTTVPSRNIPTTSHSTLTASLLGRNSISGTSTGNTSSRYSNLGLLTYALDSSSSLFSSRTDSRLGQSTSANYTRANTEQRDPLFATDTSPNEMFLSTYTSLRNHAIRHTSPQGNTSSVQTSHSNNQDPIAISRTTPGMRAPGGTNFASPPRSEIRPLGNRQSSSCLNSLAYPPGFNNTHVSQLRRANERLSTCRFDSFSSDYSSHRSDPPSFNYGMNSSLDSITPRSDDGFASGGSQFDSPSYFTEPPRLMNLSSATHSSPWDLGTEYRSHSQLATTNSKKISAFNPLSDYTLEEFVYDTKASRRREQTRPIIQRHESDLPSPTHFLPADLFHESPPAVSDINSNSKIRTEASGKASKSKYKDHDTSDTSTSRVPAERTRNEIYYDEIPIRLNDDVADSDQMRLVIQNSFDRPSNECVLNIAPKNNSTEIIHLSELRLNMESQETTTHEIPPNSCPNIISIQAQETLQPTQFSNYNTLFDWTQYEKFCHEFKMNLSDTNTSGHHELAVPEPSDIDGSSNDPVSELSSKVEADEKVNNLLPYWVSSKLSPKTEAKDGAAENTNKHSKKQRPLFVTAISDILPRQSDAPQTNAEATELTFNDKDAIRQNNKRQNYKQVLEKLEPYLSRKKEQECKQVASKNKCLAKMKDNNAKTAEKLATHSTDDNRQKNALIVRHKEPGGKSTASKVPIYEVLELNWENAKAADTSLNQACEEPSSNEVVLVENDNIENRDDLVSNDGGFIKQINVENSLQELNVEESMQEINNECSQVVSIEISTKKESIECSLPEVNENIKMDKETQVEIKSDKSGKDTKTSGLKGAIDEVKKTKKTKGQQKQQPKSNKGRNSKKNTNKKRKV